MSFLGTGAKLADRCYKTFFSGAGSSSAERGGDLLCSFGSACWYLGLSLYADWALASIGFSCLVSGALYSGRPLFRLISR